MNKLSLYVWPEFCPEYEQNMAVAIDENEEKAKQRILEKFDLDSEELENVEWGEVKVYPLDKKMAICNAACCD